MYVYIHIIHIHNMVNPCPDGQVLDRATKECRPPLKRGRRFGAATTRATTSSTNAKAKKPCPDGQVIDRTTKECRPPLKRGRTAKKSPQKSPPINVKDNTTLDKHGFTIPVYRPKVYNDAKTYKQTTIAFGKRNP
jgi:hypothetical protein